MEAQNLRRRRSCLPIQLANLWNSNPSGEGRAQESLSVGLAWADRGASKDVPSHAGKLFIQIKSYSLLRRVWTWPCLWGTVFHLSWVSHSLYLTLLPFAFLFLHFSSLFPSLFLYISLLLLLCISCNQRQRFFPGHLKIEPMTRDHQIIALWLLTLTDW